MHVPAHTNTMTNLAAKKSVVRRIIHFIIKSEFLELCSRINKSTCIDRKGFRQSQLTLIFMKNYFYEKQFSSILYFLK